MAPSRHVDLPILSLLLFLLFPFLPPLFSLVFPFPFFFGAPPVTPGAAAPKAPQDTPQHLSGLIGQMTLKVIRKMWYPAVKTPFSRLSYYSVDPQLQHDSFI